MRYHKTVLRIALLVLMVSMLAGIAGCSFKGKELSYDSLEKIFSKYEPKRLNSYDAYERYRLEDVTDDVLKAGHMYYVRCKNTDDDANRIFRYAVFCNNYKFKVQEIMRLEYFKYDQTTDSGMDVLSISLMTFESAEMAKDYIRTEFVYPDISMDPDSYAKPAKEDHGGNDGHYFYAYYYEGDGSCGCVCQDREKVIYISCCLKDSKSDLINDVCKEFSIINPLSYFSK
jgi:hypothetical protein